MTTPLPRLARVMEWATLAALVLLPVVFGLVVWFATPAQLPFAMPDGYEPTAARLRMGALAVLPATLALGWTLHRMYLLFGQFAGQDVLTRRAARLIRQIGTGLLAVAILRILATPLQSLIVTLPAMPGSRMVSVNVSSSDVGFLLAAGLMAVIGWAMEDAARVAEENRGFV